MPANPDREGGFPGAEAPPFVLDEILKLRVLRKSAKEIAEELSTRHGYPISWTHVQRLIREEAARVRARHQEMHDQRFLEQDATLETLMAQVMGALKALADAGSPPDEKLLRAAVSIADRSARLHGLDRQRVGGGQKHDWLDGLSYADLVKQAELFGLELPKPFRVGAAVSEN